MIKALLAAEAFAKGTLLEKHTGPLADDKDVHDVQEVGSSDQRTAGLPISADKCDHYHHHPLTRPSHRRRCLHRWSWESSSHILRQRRESDLHVTKVLSG